MIAGRDTVRESMYANGLSAKWLIIQLEKHGIMTDKTELSSSLSGTRKGAKVESIITTALEILERYKELSEQL